MAQKAIELKYNNKAAAGIIKDFKDVFIQSYYKKGEFKYILEADIKTAIESELVVGIETLLNIIFITLQDKQKKKLSITLAPNKGKILQV